MRFSALGKFITASALTLLQASSALAQQPYADNEGWFSLPGTPQASATLAIVPKPAYYRVCLSGELGPSLRIQVSTGDGPYSYLSADSCTDLLVTKQLKLSFAPGSLVTNVIGRYDLLGFRQALQYRTDPASSTSGTSAAR